MKQQQVAFLNIDIVNREISVSDGNYIYYVFGPDSAEVLYKRSSAEDLLIRALIQLLPEPIE